MAKTTSAPVLARGKKIKLYTLQLAAAEIGVSRSTLRDWFTGLRGQVGALEHAAHYFTESGHVLFDEKQLEALRVAIAEKGR